MEAFEERLVKHDSFEEVDRILTIVETSKRDFEKIKASLFKITYLTFSLLIVVTFLIWGIFAKDITNTLSIYITDTNVIFGVLGAFLVVTSIVLFRAIQLYNKNLLDYKLTLDQATEVIREIVPVLSRSENWSTLRKFELRLRLSKLGISTERIFEPGFDIP